MKRRVPGFDKELSLEVPKDHQKQDNGYDCGVYTGIYAASKVLGGLGEEGLGKENG